jgi:hypothetical protein
MRQLGDFAQVEQQLARAWVESQHRAWSLALSGITPSDRRDCTTGLHSVSYIRITQAPVVGLSVVYSII